ncbi:MAG: rhomboid family intramembrane serine protease [Cellvibrionaceae bacterium]|nr:rhomboid family intramembrane serine protease [Cellvibrionaceae bacterium]
MKIKNTPWLSISLSTLVLGLFLLPAQLQPALYLDTDKTTGPGLITWLSGHFIHADAEHLAWNLSALMVLGLIIETRSRAMLIASLVTGILAVNLMLASPLSDIQLYCGLSGALNTLLGVALWLLWRQRQSKLLMAIAIANSLKIIIEVMWATPLLTQPSWPPYPLSHLAGFMAAPLLCWLAEIIEQPKQHLSGDNLNHPL